MILYSQVTTLVGDVDTSLKKACVTVKETSGSADKVLKDVVSATQTMTTSTSTCLNNFDTFISKEGKVTQDALATHFTALDTYLATQSEDISTVSAASQKVRNTFSSFFLFPFGLLHENSFLSQHITQLCHLKGISHPFTLPLFTVTLALFQRNCIFNMCFHFFYQW